MKKNIQPARTQPQTTKTLFGVSTDQLKAVLGGGGVIGNTQNPAPTKPAG